MDLIFLGHTKNSKDKKYLANTICLDCDLLHDIQKQLVLFCVCVCVCVCVYVFLKITFQQATVILNCS